MKIKYRITSSRTDVAPRVYEESVFVGATKEECDELAKGRLEELAMRPSNAWEDFSLERIDVEEMTTHIASNVPKDHTPGAPRCTILRGESNPFKKDESH